MAKKLTKLIPKKRIHKSGLAPGSAIFTGDVKMENVVITIINYDKTGIKSFSPSTANEAIETASILDGTIWINIDGLHDVKSIENICSFYDIHKLTIEDIVSVNQRPKLEEHGEYIHLVLKMLDMNATDIIDSEQISLICKGNILLSFQERTGDVFDGVRERINSGKGFIRQRGASYLLYALTDSVVDRYFYILEFIGERLDRVEIGLLDNPEKAYLNDLHLLRKEILKVRRAVYPVKDVALQLEKTRTSSFPQELDIFLRDLYDHTVRVIETVELYRDNSSGLLELYMNSVSNRMNEVMMTLTIIATIFIPLTFIAGIYGMNFTNMPELQYKYGYFIILAVMFFLLLSMLAFFKRKKWF